MRQSKLVELLEKLDGNQWHNLKTFVNSPFHNTNPDVVTLFSYLHSAWQSGFGEKNLDRRTAFASIFPIRPFQYQAFNQLMSRLLKLAETWLAWQRLERDGALLESLKAEELLKLKLEKHYRQASRAAERAMEKKPMESEHYYYSQAGAQSQTVRLGGAICQRLRLLPSGGRKTGCASLQPCGDLFLSGEVRKGTQPAATGRIQRHPLQPRQ